MKKHNFRIIITQAEYQGDLVIIPMHANCLLDKCFEEDLSGGLKKLKELSALEVRPHQAVLTMQYRDDPLPRGFKKEQTRISGAVCH